MFDIVFPKPAGLPDLVLPMTDDDQPGTIVARAAAAEVAWSATASTAQAELAMAVRMATKACGASGVTVEPLGVVPADSYFVAGSTPVLVVTALGPDAQPRRTRLEAPIAEDISKAIRNIVARHVAAQPVAARWADIGAKGAVDAVAKGLMDFNGILLHEVVEALRHVPKVDFGGIKALRSGSFTWRDFAVIVDATTKRDCRLNGNVITVPKSRQPETLADSALGKPLRAIAEQHFMPPGIVVERMETRANEELEITLQTSTIAF